MRVEDMLIPVIVVGRDRVRALSVLLWSLARHRGGATAVEYALIAALIAVPVVPAATSVGRELSGLMVNIGAYLADVPTTEPDPPYP